MAETIQEHYIRMPPRSRAGQPNFPARLTSDSPVSYPAATSELADEFAACAEAWENAAFLDMEEMFADPDYRRIIEMGPAVTPLILQRLQARPNWWFPALSILTGVDPTNGKTLGKLMETTEIWLKWAQEQKILA